jgi:hypothetical protein
MQTDERLGDDAEADGAVEVLLNGSGLMGCVSEKGAKAGGQTGTVSGKDDI